MFASLAEPVRLTALITAETLPASLREVPSIIDAVAQEQILVLHYFSTSDGSPMAGDHISFKEVREAMLYLPKFEERAVAPLLGRFGANPEQILEPAQQLGGQKEDLGDFSVTIPAFPRVPITLVFWKKDEEFEARLTILFDRTVIRYLPTEDIVLATQMMAYRLIGMAGRS